MPEIHSESTILNVENITMQFGGLKAVDNVSFRVPKNALFGLIGPNGAGKTTAFNVLTGVYQPTAGIVYFNGQQISGQRPYQISQLGMTRTFQNIRLFRQLTTLENVMIANDQHSRYGMREPLLQTSSFFRSETENKEYSLHLLEVFGLASKATEVSSSLPYGEQRKLEIARALATKPQLILLDEPAAGMNHAETKTLMDTLQQVREDFNITILLIEHDMKLVMGICERIVVLDHGEKIAEGNPHEIRSSQKVIEAYLGKDAEV